MKRPTASAKNNQDKQKAKAIETLKALGLTEKQARDYLELIDKEWANVKTKAESKKVVM